MSTSTLILGMASPTLAFLSTAPPSTVPFVIDVGPQASGQIAAISDEVNRVLRVSLNRSGFSQAPAQSRSDRPNPNSQQTWRVVAPGVVVTQDEYTQRYSAIDLERYRKAMPPEVFRTFVRFIGAVPGRSDLDVVQMTTPPEL
jgi:hypothetical protein